MTDTLRALYVDDEPDILEISKRFLEQSREFSVATALSAPEAFRLLDQERFDIIISDYEMPEMDGIQFLVEVRTRFGSIPFIIVTGKGTEEIAINAFENGADFYLQKCGEPRIQFIDLRSKVKKAVERRQPDKQVTIINRLYSVLSAANRAGMRISDKSELLNEICRILIDIGGFTMAWVGFANPEKHSIMPFAAYGHIDGYLDTIAISIDDIFPGRTPTGTAYRERTFNICNDIVSDPRMAPWLEEALNRGYRSLAAFPFALDTKNAGIITLYAPVPGFFEGQIVDLLDLLAVDISFFLRTIDDQNDRKREEEALRNREAYLIRAEEIGRTGSWELQLAENTVIASHGAGIIYGLEGTRWTTDDIQKIPLDEYRPLLDTALQDLITGKSHYNIEFKIRRQSDGAILDIHSVAEYDPGRNIVFGVIHDITERKQVEEALRIQHHLSLKLNQCITLDDACNQILSATLQIDGLDSGGIYIADPTTGVLDLLVSQGLSPTFISHVSHFAPDTSQVRWAQAGTPFYGKFVDIHLPGTDDIRDKEGITTIACIPVHYEGELIALVNVASHTIDNIPEYARKILEMLAFQVGSTVNRINSRIMLLESEVRFRSLFENFQDPVIISGFDAGVQYANDAAFRLAGIASCNDLHNLNILQFITPVSLEKVMQDLETIRVNGGPLISEYQMRTGAGEIKWVEAVGIRIPWLGEDRDLISIRDITKKKLADEAIRLANKKLNLLSGITRHDINNQLLVLTGFLSILEKKQRDPTLNEYSQKISTAAKRISSMIQFTKEYEQIGIHAPAWQDCHTLVDTAANQAILGQIVVKNDFHAGLELFADPLIVKVFYNLIDNAVRYGGKITTIRFSGFKSREDHLIVCEDDGVGVPAEEKEKIFERGFGKNTGLGLAISREILDITGITITETGERGKGARFEIVVPKGMWRGIGEV